MRPTEAGPQRARPVARELALLLGAAAVLALLGWLLFGIGYLHSHQIEAFWLFPDGPFYLDLTVYITRWQVFHTPAFFQPSPLRSTFAYPPAAALFYGFLYGSHHMKFAYNVLTGAWWLTLLGLAGAELWRVTRSAIAVCGVLIALILLSYPAVFLFERANIEIFLWMLIAVGCLLYRKGHCHGAAASFGLATAIKLYPILLFGLFLSRKREWRALITGILSSVAITLLAIWYTGPSFGEAARGFLSGFTSFQGSYSKGGWLDLIRFDHSLFSPLKLLLVSRGISPSTLSTPYYLVAASSALILFFVWIRKRATENRIAFLLVLMVLLPAVSFEYTLVQLFVPVFMLIMLLIQPAESSTERRNTLIALGGLLFLLLPADLAGMSGLVFAGQAQTLALLLVLWSALRMNWAGSNIPQSDQTCTADSAETRGSTATSRSRWPGVAGGASR